MWIPETANYLLTYNDQNWGFKFEDDLKNELEDLVPSYNILTYLDFTFAVPFILFGIIILYVGIDYFLKVFGLTGYSEVDLTNLPESKSNGSWIIPVLWIGVMIFGGNLLNRLKNYLFPIIFISLGKQVNELSKRKRISNLIFGVIILGILINLISNWIG